MPKEATLGYEIRAARAKAGVTLRKFAERVGLSPAHLSDIELNRRRPSSEALERIAAELASVGVTYESLDRLVARLDPDIQEWVSETPQVRQLLRTLLSSRRDVGEVLQEVEEWLRVPKGRRSP